MILKVELTLVDVVLNVDVVLREAIMWIWNCTL